ncbi:MAG: DUF1080 domain-containing protein [Ignavibacteriae bacterium]|nr:DUF1080 domain-containing protein [Ignavibacteriota bacterium]
MINGSSPRGNIASFTLRRVQRTSPTLGAQPPAGAVVLFDGKDLSQWKVAGKEERPAAWKLADGAMEVAPNGGTIVTKKAFGDCDLHLEFRTPFMPTKRGQERGNSGVYMQGRYEIQCWTATALAGEGQRMRRHLQGGTAAREHVCASGTVADLRYQLPRAAL